MALGCLAMNFFTSMSFDTSRSGWPRPMKMIFDQCALICAWDLPATLDHKNAADIPDRAVILLGTAAAILVLMGTLTTTSRSFLFMFAVVCESHCYSCPYSSLDLN